MDDLDQAYRGCAGLMVSVLIIGSAFMFDEAEWQAFLPIGGPLGQSLLAIIGVVAVLGYLRWAVRGH